MKIIQIIVLSFLFGLQVGAQAPIKGIWQTGEDNTIIEIYLKNGAWYGKIISSDNPKAKAGTDILVNFNLVNGTWKGKLFAIRRKSMLDAIIKPKANELTIDVSAGFYSTTLHWVRMKN